jgi:hypothetical protein
MCFWIGLLIPSHILMAKTALWLGRLKEGVLIGKHKHYL